MVHSGVRVLFRVLGALGLLTLALLAFFGWRLEQGPLSLSLLTPYIEDALADPEGDFEVVIDGTELAWGGWQRPLNLRVVGVVVRDADHRLIARLPMVAVTLAPRALLDGEVALRRVEILSPSLHITRLESGEISLGGEAPLPIVPSIGSPVHSPGDGQNPVGPSAVAGGDASAGERAGRTPLSERLDRWVAMLTDQAGGVARLTLRDGAIDFDDLRSGVSMHMPRVNATLIADSQGVAGDIAAHLHLAQSLARIDLSISHRVGEGTVEAEATISGLDARQLAQAVPALAAEGTLDLALSGSARAVLDLDLLEGPAPLSGVLDAGFALEGRDGALALPEPMGTTYPLPRISLSGGIEDGFSAVFLDKVDVDLGGPTVHATLRAEDPLTAPRVAITTSVLGLSIEDLKRFWPHDKVDGAREWIALNLSEGTIRQGDFTFDLAGPSLQDIDITALQGLAMVEGIAVDYRNPLPPLEQMSGEIVFGLKEIAVKVATGRLRGVEGLEVVKGTVVFGGLDAEDQTAAIAVSTKGPLASVMAVIDHQPLNYAKAVGIDPKTAKGAVKADLSFAFPLLKDLTFEQMAIRVEGDVEGVALPKAAFGRDVSDGKLKVVLDQNGMDISGTATLASVPVALVWRENFVDAPFLSRYKVKGTLDAKGMASLGIDPALISPPYGGGVAKADLTYIRLPGGRATLEGRLDLTETVLDLEAFGWRKPAGSLGAAKVSARLGGKDDRLDIDMTAEPQMTAKASVFLNAKGDEIKRVDVDSFVVGNTRLAGSVSLGGSAGPDIRIGDGVLDLRPYFDRRRGAATSPTPAEGVAAKPTKDLPAFSATVTLRQIMLANDVVFEHVTARAARDAHHWRQAVVNAAVRGSSPLALALEPKGTQRRFTLSAADAGTILRGFDVIETVAGGNLSVEALSDPGGVARGRVLVKDFRLQKAPVLAQILSVAGLTGILDVLGGQGIAFSTLVVPFVYDDPVVTVSEAQAYGNAIGLTAEGAINLDDERLSLKGTVVPAYAINSLLGKIPLLGSIIVGGKGQGVIGVNYAVSGDVSKPAISVNPLSALTPGFLRGIFKIFDQPDQTATEKVGGTGG
ncbi:YhdP family protein [Rhodospirillum rubrum]|uniref:DUF3971 domain-containing protein n=1 Tax=Rhodospirillum rubrum (strain ATCC 11170 / ATH 1.1.1 / DSM 467 / LMG 4362 / NCIMB 8255 / S1) TaxID=269796 RepID=Q2RSQ8_RHORT|nr:AsmA-like C-terminal domain-containing protein [Rhodospirillum rubrum]ABC22837.1 hypothetical protein Rru_A2037 [Rhodospirillum rubrum ATCC 11170]MBK5954444.1 hypothetical protein [Rhodospirillum rubrum]QXG78826.1 DUF3971 domain-containing protein [Rhodospirillum rubrum]HAP99797.1 hypothetical protein [Rhodospirillum rubrum]